MGHEVGTADESDPEFQEFIKKYVRVEVAGPYGTDHILVEEEYKNHSISPILTNQIHVGGVAITFFPDDEIKTRDGRNGVVKGSLWIPELVLRKKNEWRCAYFAVKVSFGDHYEYHFVDDLFGPRFVR